MPYLLDRTDPLVPPHDRYLRADPARVAAWRDRLPDAGPRVGLAWQGNPDYRLDRRRSCPLRCFAPLAEQPDIRLVSLQKGLGVDQAEAVPWREALMEPERRLGADGAFLDTAAVVTVLDLVITSDTAIAHLAGGLGLPVWLLLADAPDWRWGLSGGTLPWYPSMHLFRQSAPGGWDGVIRRVASEIVRGGLAPAVG